MKFGPVAIADAVGCILAHSLPVPGGRLNKGTVLTADDLLLLQAVGIAEVVVARLAADDMAEDAAAAAVAAALAGDGVVMSAARTGRCNLSAARPGVAVIDGSAIDRINRVDAAITVATLPRFAAVAAAQMLATVKIIPFAATQAAVVRCVAIARETAPLALAPFRPHRAGLIQTRQADTKASVLAATVATTTARLDALGSTIAACAVVAHAEAAVANALAEQRQAGCDPILVLGASAIADRRDVIPAAVTALGGEVVHLGMPVDPGNLLLLARIGATRVIGLPGCARSPKLNGFDWVLQRALAGLEVGAADIMAMGVGGLLTEIASRPLPRARATADVGAGESKVDAAFASGKKEGARIAAMVLAAGRGRRFGGDGKLLAPFRGRPLVLAAVEAALQSRASPVVVVSGHQRQTLAAALEGVPVRIVANPDHALGLSSSLRAGLAVLPKGLRGAVLLLGDMPLISATLVDRLIAAFDTHDGEAICVPTYRGERGNPVLWPARLFARLAAIEGDQGGRALLRDQDQRVVEVECDEVAVLIDVDDAEAMARAERLAAEGGVDR